MDQVKLREALEVLHLELLRMTPQDETTREKRDALAARIEEALSQEEFGNYDVSLAGLMDEASVSFADRHPNAAQLIRSARKLLSSIGI